MMWAAVSYTTMRAVADFAKTLRVIHGADLVCWTVVAAPSGQVETVLGFREGYEPVFNAPSAAVSSWVLYDDPLRAERDAALLFRIAKERGGEVVSSLASGGPEAEEYIVHYHCTCSNNVDYYYACHGRKEAASKIMELLSKEELNVVVYKELYENEYGYGEDAEPDAPSFEEFLAGVKERDTKHSVESYYYLSDDDYLVCSKLHNGWGSQP